MLTHKNWADKNMNAPENLVGRSILIELGTAFAESVCPNISPEASSTLNLAFTEFLDGKISSTQCHQIVFDTIGRDDPVTRIEELLNLPDEPLPYVADSDQDEPTGSLRRRTRTWTAPEDQRLLGGVIRYGLDNWQAVAHYLGSGRNRAQCSQRWTRGLNPRISKKGWTPEEDRQLEELVRQYGKKSWAKIASIMGNRSDVQCRYHYRQLGCDLSPSEMPLMHPCKLSLSSDCMSPVTPPMNSYATERISLAEGRTFQSSPMMMNSRPNAGPLLIPLAPLTSRHRELHAPPLVPSVFGQRWDVCGTDPLALDSFLSHFQGPIKC